MALRRGERWLLVLIVALTAIKGLLWSVAIPLWQGPDENRHFAAVQFIAEHGRLPGPEDFYHDDENVLAAELSEVTRLWYHPTVRQTFGPGRDGPNEADLRALDPSLRTSTERGKITLALQLPPLYYLMGALFYLPVRGRDLLARVFVVRQLSVLLSLGTVWTSYLVARRVFPKQRAMWFTVPVLVSFQPMFTFVGAVVNTDALMFAICTGLTYLLIRVLDTRLDWKLALGIGGLFGAGLLTKPFILAMAVPLVFVVGWDLWRARDRRGRKALALGVMALSTMAVWGGWLWRSAQMGNNPFYANPLRVGQLKVEHPFYDYGLWRYGLDYVRSLAGGTWVSLWADFGWIDTPLDTSYYLVLHGIAALACVGLALHVWRARRGGAQDARGVVLVLMALCVLSMVGTLGATNYYSWRARGVGGGIQGRYYLGAIVPFVLLLALGLLSLLPERWRPGGHFALRWGMIVLNLVCLFQVLLPRYYL